MTRQTPRVTSQVAVPIGGLGQSAVVLQRGTHCLGPPIIRDTHAQPSALILQELAQSVSSEQPIVPVIPSAEGIVASLGIGIASV